MIFLVFVVILSVYIPNIHTLPTDGTDENEGALRQIGQNKSHSKLMQ